MSVVLVDFVAAAEPHNDAKQESSDPELAKIAHRVDSVTQHEKLMVDAHNCRVKTMEAICPNRWQLSRSLLVKLKCLGMTTECLQEIGIHLVFIDVKGRSQSRCRGGNFT